MSGSWRVDAHCAGVDVNIFFPGRGGSGGGAAPAKAICAPCRVKAACLAEALTWPVTQDLGVRGGLSEKERKALRRQRAGRLAPVVTLPVPSVPQQQPRRAA